MKLEDTVEKMAVKGGGILSELARKVEMNRQKAIDSPLLRARWKKYNNATPFSAPSTPKQRIKSMLPGIREDKIQKAYLCRTYSECGIGSTSDYEEDDPVMVFMFEAIRENKHKRVKCIIKDKKVGVNRLNVNGVGLLHEASYRGSIKCVKVLIDYGADVNFIDSEGWTPLHAAVCGEQMSCIKYLIENGADINYNDMQGVTPLRMAVNVKNIEIIDYLVKRGADVMAVAKDGKSSFQFAIEMGDDKILTYFLHIPSFHVR